MIIQIAEILASVFDSALMVYFLYRFNRAQFKFSPVVLGLSLLHLGVVLVGDYLLTDAMIPISIALLGIQVIISLYICNKRYIQGILAASLYEVVLIVVNSVLVLVMSMLIKDYDKLMQGSVTASRLITLILSKVILFAVLMLVLSVFPYKEEKSNVRRGNGILTFLFTLITIIGLGAVMYLTSMPEAVNWQAPMLIITVAFLLVNLMLYILINQILRLQQNNFELKLMQEKIRYEEQQHGEMMETWERIRGLRHDMKNHLLTIDGFVEQGETEQCRAYLHDLLPQLEKGGRIISSDNPTLDYLINTKLGGLKETRIIVSGSIGSLSDIKDTDLCCILGNILDNAVEAIGQVPQDEKRIELLFSKQNDNRIIICRNTVSKSVLTNNKDLKTTKKDPSAHGIGHKIVESIVAGYHGSVDYFEEDDMFGVQVLLPETNTQSK